MNQDQNNRKQDWQKVDARVLGQILAAQNILFVLPDTTRIAGFFAQTLVSVPGVTSCRVCLGDISVQVGLDSDVCRECEAFRKEAGEPLVMPIGFKCRLADQHDIRIITLESYEHTLGFIVFRTDTTGVFESYRPFVNNLANYIALSLENRRQKSLLQEAHDELERKVGERTKALTIVNEQLEEDISERKRVEKALIESEAHYRGLFEHSPISLWEEDFSEVKRHIDELRASGVSDLRAYFDEHPEEVERFVSATKIIAINQTTLKLFKADSKERLLEGLNVVFSKESLDIFKEELITFAGGDTQYQSETVLGNLADGKLFTVVRFSIAPGYKNTWGKVFVSISDITESKQAELALKEAERVKAKLLEDLNEAQRVGQIGSWDWDSTTDMIIWSNEYYRICGFDPKLPAPNYLEHLKAYTPESSERLDAAVKKTMETGEPYELDLEFADPGKRRRWICARGEVKRDTSGCLTGLRGTAQNITERKQMEEELRQSERFKTIINQIGIVFLTVPDEEVYEGVLKVVLEVMESRFGIFGFIADNGDLVIPSMTREVWNKCQIPDKSIVFPHHTWGKSLWGRAIREKKAFYSNDPFHVPEGHIPIFNFLTVPIVFKDETIGLLSVGNKDGGYTEEDKDLLESIASRLSPILNARRQNDKQKKARASAEEATRKSEGQLRTLVQTIPDLIWLKDTEGVYLACNLMFERFFGARETDIIGKTDYDFIDEKLADFFLELDRKAIAAGKPSSNEEWITFADDGHRALLHTIKTPMFDAEGKLIGVLGIGRDITERKQREEQLVIAKEEWEKTFDAMPEIITIQDKDMHIIRANKAAHQFFQAELGELNGKHCYEVFAGASALCSGCPLVETLKDRKEHSAIITHKNLGGIFEVSAAAVTADNGEIEYVIHVAKNITELKKMEEHLHQAQKMEAIGTLAGGIAHDFNNILAAILGFSEFAIRDLPEDSKAREDIEQVIQSGKKATELVKQILTFSRQSEQKRQPLQIHLVIKEALKLLRSSIPTTIAIHQNVVDCGLVMADPTQVHQIIMNLCTNAYHAMRETGGELDVSMEVVEMTTQDSLNGLALQPGPHVKLSVRDTGCGMSKELVKRIFEPYFTTKKQGEGTGLGLSIVHGIVESHHGHITVYSEPGKGTEFHVYLPQVQGHDKSLAEEAGEEIPQGSGTVLVVDDEPILGKMLQRMLSNLGYEVLLCSSSTEALEVFTQQTARIVLVLTDMNMPVMNGAELARRIKQLSPAMPVVLCTGFSEIMDEKKARQMGIDGFMMKPVIQRQLAQTLHDILEKKGGSGPAV